MNEPSRNFLSLLFDLTFDEFVTTRILRVLFVLSIVLAAIAGLGVFFGLSIGGGSGVLIGLLLGVAVFFLYVIIARLVLEGVVALFKIAENTSVLARNSTRSHREASGAPRPPSEL